MLRYLSTMYSEKQTLEVAVHINWNIDRKRLRRHYWSQELMTKIYKEVEPKVSNLKWKLQSLSSALNIEGN